MQTFETDLADALSLISVAGLMQLSRSCFDLNAKYLDYEFDGLLPAQDTEAQRQSTADTMWPAPSVRHIVARVGATTVREYLGRLDASLRDQLGRYVFTLWMSAFDAFLERHGGGSSTLGTKLSWLQSSFTLPASLSDDLCEIISRRNDVAHGNGYVSAKYLSPSPKYAGLKNSSWVTTYALPDLGTRHAFAVPYLYWVLERMWAVAELVCP